MFKIKIEFDSDFRKKFKILSIFAITLITIVLTFINSYFLYINTSTYDSISRLKSNESAIIVSEQVEELKNYKLMYLEMKDANQKILSTVYWSIGGLATAIFTIIGANFFFNYRFGKSELESIENRLKFQNESDKGENFKLLNAQLSNDFHLLQETITASISKQESDLSDKLGMVIEKYNNENKSKFESIVTNMNSLNGKVDTDRKEIIRKMDKNYNSLKSDFYSLEGEKWRNRNVKGNELIHYVREGECILMSKTKSVESCLDKIIMVLREMENKPTLYITEIDAFIQTIPNEYQLKKAEIVSLLDKLDFN